MPLRNRKKTLLAVLAALCLLSCRKPGARNDNRPQALPGRTRVAHWEPAYRSPQSINQPELPFWSYNSISVVSESVVFVAADYPMPGDMNKRIGIIVRTSDGGASWTESQLDVKGINLAALNSIAMASPSAGWAVGVDESGYTVVYSTSDGGQTWTGKKTSFKQSPTSVVVAGNGKVLLGGVGPPPKDPEGTGGPSDILASTDAGATWLPQYHLPVSVEDLAVAGEGSGWAAGLPASIYSSRDGGRIWSAQRTGLEGGAAGTATASKFAVRTIDFVDEMHGWAGASNSDARKSVVFGTTNGGVTWEPLWINDDMVVRDIHFLNAQEGWVVTDRAQYAYHSTDGGHTWASEEIKFPQRVSFYRIGAADASHVWAVGGGAIIRRIAE